MTSAAETSPTPATPPELRVTRFEDYAQIAHLETLCNLEAQPEDEWRRLWLENPVWPRVEKTWPIGWVLENAAGTIVGSVTSVPSLYTFKGRDLISANGRAWVAAPEYRGFALMLMDEYFNQETADIFINTTVGPLAVQILGELSARVPLGDWEGISYWITHYPGFAKRALEKLKVPMPGLLAGPTGLALKIKDSIFNKSLPNPPTGYTIEQPAQFDDRFDAFWKQLVSQNQQKLLACRDRATLAWHFTRPMRRGRMRILTIVRDGLLRAYCIIKREDASQGIRRMRLVDYQTLETNVDLLPALIKPALRICADEKIDILDLHGRGIPKMHAFDELAPYRQKFRNWPYYYRANDPALSAELAQPIVWDPSSYDGDSSFE